MKKIRLISLVFIFVLIFISLVSCQDVNYVKDPADRGDQTTGQKNCKTDGHSFDGGVCTVCGATYSDSLIFRLSDDGLSYVVASGKNCKDRKVVIPNEYNGKPVTEIGEGAFYYCESMEIVKIPASVVNLDDGAFHRCYNLVTVVFENGSKLERIGNSAFLFCDHLKSINFPEGLRDIGDEAFLHCFNFFEIVLPDGLLHIGKDAFAYTGYYHRSDNWKNGSTLYIGNHFITIKGKTTGTKYTVEEGTRVIADGLFANCTNMRNIEFPTSVTSIGSGAFEGCKNLQYVNFKPGTELKVIHSKAFLNCENIVRVNYGGTVELWNLVEKESGWIYAPKNFLVHCTDGDLKAN